MVDRVGNRGLASGAGSTPRSITAVILFASFVRVFATKEIRFGGINVHHPKVGCLGEGAIYPKSYDQRGPESAADQSRFRRSGASQIPEAHPAPRNPDLIASGNAIVAWRYER